MHDKERLEDIKANSPSRIILGLPIDLKEWKEAAEIFGLGALLPGLAVIWGYAYFIARFTPSGISEWFPILFASFNLTATAMLGLGVAIGAGGILATIAHGSFLPAWNRPGALGFRLTGWLNHFLFWDVAALMGLLIATWLWFGAKALPWSHRIGILFGNLLISYLAYRIWAMELKFEADPSRGSVWNHARPFLWRILLFFLFLVCTSMWPHGFTHQILDRALVMSGVKSDWTSLRIAGNHLEPLKRRSGGKLVVNTTLEGGQSYIYVDQGRALFQRIGTDALLELRMPDGKVLRYRLPLADFREVGNRADNDS